MPTSQIEAMWLLILTQRNQLLQTQEENVTATHELAALKSVRKAHNPSSAHFNTKPQRAFA